MPTASLIRDPYDRLRNASGNADTFTRLFIAPADLTDTFLTSTDPDKNNDNGNYLWCGDTLRSLIRLDLSGIPAGRTIKSARLKLYSVDTTPDDVTLAVYRILAANSSWTAATATWNKRDGVNAWAGAAGCSTSGTDYSATPLYTGTMDADYGEWDLLDLDTDEFALMAAANYGMIIISSDPESHTRQWTSTNQASEYYRPCAMIEYEAA